MRWVRIIAVCLVASLGLGCFVFKELDSGQKELDRYGSAQSETHVATTSATPARPTKKAASASSSMAAWWQKAHTLSSDKMDESITSCRIHGHVEFMRKSDCAARGGGSG